MRLDNVCMTYRHKNAKKTKIIIIYGYLPVQQMGIRSLKNEMLAGWHSVSQDGAPLSDCQSKHEP